MIFPNLIINKKIWPKLEKMFHSNQMPHALLLHGPEGSGKEAHAIKLASLINYKTNADMEKMKIFQHPSIHLILPLIKEKNINKNSDALNALSEKSLELLIDMKKRKMLNPYYKISFTKKSTILINSIRDIKKNIHLNNTNYYNIYLIFEAEKLCYPRNEAGNALLKVLEEPPEKTIFILVTSKKEKILDTIQSRCCDFYFKKIETKKIIQYLDANNYEYNNRLLVQLCNNNLNLIIEMINQKLDLNALIKKAKMLINCLINNNSHQEYSKYIEDLFKKNKKEFEIYIKIIIIILNDLNKINNHYGNCIILDDKINVKKLYYTNCINIVEKYYNELSYNLNPSIGFFAMMIEMKNALINKDYLVNE
jgi:DNA polymerase III delta prime subunit